VNFGAAVARGQSAETVARGLLAALPNACGGAPDLVLLFFTAPLRDEAEDLARRLRNTLEPRVFVAVSGESVIGGEEEVEQEPAASLLAGRLPDVELQPFRIGASEWSALLRDEERLQQRVGSGPEHRAQLLLGDPFTTPIDPLLRRLDEVLQAPTFGGMASAARQPGGNLLMLGERAFVEGAVGVGFGAAVAVETVVSQGCRPIGDPVVVTRAQENLILELGRRRPVDVARETIEALPEREQGLLQGGLFIGVAIDEYRDRFARGDFLVRGLMGVEPESGALAVGDAVRAGQTVQFHVRDAATAHEDLAELLAPQRYCPRPAGALLFSCNGRGTRLFREPHHDARTTLAALPGTPLAGFFAMGELGPVGGHSFIHGHTASLALFRPARADGER
jgi:small ligand-binding sensory domain FIST